MFLLCQHVYQSPISVNIVIALLHNVTCYDDQPSYFCMINSGSIPSFKNLI